MDARSMSCHDISHPLSSHRNSKRDPFGPEQQWRINLETMMPDFFSSQSALRLIPYPLFISFPQISPIFNIKTLRQQQTPMGGV
jgi:hypothetical protein